MSNSDGALSGDFMARTARKASWRTNGLGSLSKRRRIGSAAGSDRLNFRKERVQLYCGAHEPQLFRSAFFAHLFL